MNFKKPLLVGAAVATISLGSLGVVNSVSAATDTSSGSDSGTSLIQKIASKFNLNQDEVQAVFDEARTEREANMKADQAERIAQAVTDGDLTQEQADYITKALAEIETLRGDSSPEDEDTTVRDQIKEKMEALRTWAEEQNIEMRDFMSHGGRGGHGGPGGFGGPRESSDTSTDDTGTSS